MINNYQARAQYFVNTVGQRSGWLAIRVQGTRSNRDGIGAVLRIRAGDLLQTRVVGAGHGYASQYSLEQVVGLGARSRADSVVVRWPSGLRERFGPFTAGARVRLVEGRGRPALEGEAGAKAARRATSPLAGGLILLLALAGLAGFALLTAVASASGQDPAQLQEPPSDGR